MKLKVTNNYKNVSNYAFKWCSVCETRRKRKQNFKKGTI